MKRTTYHNYNLYHLTPVRHLDIVTKEGIKSDKDPKGLGRIWLCKRKEVVRIAKHLNKLRPNDWRHYLLEIPRWKLTGRLVAHSSSPGVFIYYGDIPANAFDVVGDVVVYQDDSGASVTPIR